MVFLFVVAVVTLAVVASGFHHFLGRKRLHNGWVVLVFVPYVIVDRFAIIFHLFRKFCGRENGTNITVYGSIFLLVFGENGAKDIIFVGIAVIRTFRTVDIPCPNGTQRQTSRRRHKGSLRAARIRRGGGIRRIRRPVPTFLRSVIRKGVLTNRVHGSEVLFPVVVVVVILVVVVSAYHVIRKRLQSSS